MHVYHDLELKKNHLGCQILISNYDHDFKPFLCEKISNKELGHSLCDEFISSSWHDLGLVITYVCI